MRWYINMYRLFKLYGIVLNRVLDTSVRILVNNNLTLTSPPESPFSSSSQSDMHSTVTDGLCLTTIPSQAHRPIHVCNGPCRSGVVKAAPVERSEGKGRGPTRM